MTASTFGYRLLSRAQVDLDRALVEPPRGAAFAEVWRVGPDGRPATRRLIVLDARDEAALRAYGARAVPAILRDLPAGRLGVLVGITIKEAQ